MWGGSLDSKACVLGPVPAGLDPVPTPASLGIRTDGHSDHWAAGSQHPAASSPGSLSARCALPSPPGGPRAWSRWNQRALPFFVCWCFLPFTACFLFSGLSGPGESRGQPCSQLSTPGRPPGGRRRLCLWGPRLSHPLPAPARSSSSLAARPSPSRGTGDNCGEAPARG